VTAGQHAEVHRLRGKCGPSAQYGHTGEANFRATIRQVLHDCISGTRKTTTCDFVRTHKGDIWGNVAEVKDDGIKVRGFCTGARKLVTKLLQAVQIHEEDLVVKWKGSSLNLLHTAIARIWAHQLHSTARGRWLEDETVDIAVRWSLYGDTKSGGLAPCLTRNGYIPCVAFQELLLCLKDMRQAKNRTGRPLLQVALEGLTGMHGCKWKETNSLQPESGIEIMMPLLQQALKASLELPTETWHQLNVCGLQPQQYVKAGKLCRGYCIEYQ
jgi:hypothetical protein